MIGAYTASDRQTDSSSASERRLADDEPAEMQTIASHSAACFAVPLQQQRLRLDPEHAAQLFRQDAMSAAVRWASWTFPILSPSRKPSAGTRSASNGGPAQRLSSALCRIAVPLLVDVRLVNATGPVPEIGGAAAIRPARSAPIAARTYRRFTAARRVPRQHDGAARPGIENLPAISRR